MNRLPEDAGIGPAAVLSRFRADFHACVTARRDEISELADAVLCADGPVRNLAALSLAPEHQRGHGALYDAVNQGRIDITRLRRVLAGLPLPRTADGRLMLAVDVSNWLRPGAATSPDRLFCHVYGRGKGQAQMIPGWPYSVVAALEPGRTSWTAVLDAVLCADGPVRNLAALSLAPEHQRGHGALYDAVNQGRINITRLRRVLAGLPLPRTADGRLMLAVDVSNWLRPGAATSPDRLFCHVYGRGKGQAQMIPGWPYSVVAALEPGRTSWTAVLDAVRLGPDDDEIAVTAAQVRDVIARLIEAGHWQEGDPAILVIFDAGYDMTRLAYLLADLPIQVLGRLRSDRVMQLPAPPRQPGTLGRPRKHGGELALSDPATWPAPGVTTSTLTSRYGMAVAAGWDRVHARLTHRAAWLDHDGPLPVIEGTLIRLQVDHLPGDRDPRPLWLWCSATGTGPADVDRLWQAFLRRFDLEHTFRLFKQVLGWTAPKLRDPQAADRWTWLIITAHAQLRLARPLAADLRHPWERPALPGRLTPARVRRGFRNIRATAAQPAGAPKPGRPGPGRPPGSKNRHPAPRYDVGKTTRRERTLKAQRERTG